jgi:hypothetical protein
MQKTIIDVSIKAKDMDSIKEALKPSNHDSELYLRTIDGNFFKLTGIIKKVPKLK